MNDAEMARWVETMPVLARIVRSKEPPPDDGDDRRETEWGTLICYGDHYTLFQRKETS